MHDWVDQEVCEKRALIMAKRKSDMTRTRPLTLAALRQYGAFEGLSLPTGRFDPNGQWKHTYQIWLVGGGKQRVRGFLRLERASARGGNSVLLKVDMSVLQAAGAVHHTKATLRCAADSLATPRSWQIESTILDASGKPIEATGVTESASAKDGKIEVTAGTQTFVRKVPQVFTSNWSLFDVVQRLPGKEAKPLEFALLEDLDLVKKRQRLSYWKTMNLELGGKTLRLHGYQQIGNGILPYQYWVDDQRRLLFAISGTRAYIFDPDAPKRVARQRQMPAARRRRQKK